MKTAHDKPGRRSFIRTTATLGAGFTAIGLLPKAGFGLTPPEEGLHIVGPKAGFSPQIGTMVSMMNWMRAAVLNSVKNMSTAELDYLHDPGSNSIGSMLLHLVATETFYQGNTFDGRKDFTSDEKARLGAAMSLGEEGRKQIKGNRLNYYLDQLRETRERTLTEFKKRDDHWLMAIDPKFFGNQPTNNYCKWFHVCEHESNHNGQIKYIKSRLPGAKGSND